MGGARTVATAAGGGGDGSARLLVWAARALAARAGGVAAGLGAGTWRKKEVGERRRKKVVEMRWGKMSKAKPSILDPMFQKFE